MRFVQTGDGWELVDDGSRVIAALRSKLEVLALYTFCEKFLDGPRGVPEHFSIEYKGEEYTVTPLGGSGEKINLMVTGSGESTTIRTQFVLPPAEPPA